MSEQSNFFNSINRDRPYDAEYFAEYFAKFFTKISCFVQETLDILLKMP